MSSPALVPQQTHVATLTAARAATARIAPTWPLDRFIAVNPFWQMVDRPFPEVAAELTALSGTRLLMPRAWYAQRYRRGELRREHLAQAIERAGSTVSVSGLEALMSSEEPVPRVRTLMVDVVDATRDFARQMDWRHFVGNAISQLCASYFDGGQAQIPSSGGTGLYARWLEQARADLAPVLLMGLSGYRAAVRDLPETAEALIVRAIDELAVDADQVEPYLSSLLLQVNGWASWCAYRRWSARLEGGDDDTITELLAIRLAWEWLLLRASDASIAARWRHVMSHWPQTDAGQAHDWLLQHAVEIAWQESLLCELPRALSVPEPEEAPAVQAAFCIDVRSEVYRRALEAQDDGIETIGFAGFFGMPIEYAPVGASTARALLPGLLAPRLRVTDVGIDEGTAARRQGRLRAEANRRLFQKGGVSSFAFVDAIGPLMAGRLLVDGLRRPRPEAHWDRAGLTASENARRKPRLTHAAGGGGLDDEARVDLAAGILGAMGLTRRHGRLIALVGHGSQTRNNPHAAGLDCGACCGQSGEVNARAAAALLNEPAVREGLAARGLHLPPTTWFVPGLHDTTTDEVHLFDLDEVPASHAEDLRTLRGWLDAASTTARRERAPRLGLGDRDDVGLARGVQERATDWATVQPEWGLADNCAFIVAPRCRTRGLDLKGRSFLHDYRQEDDPGFAILEAILTAPMLVTHWINMQYYASTVDNARYGSGNKVLHNVVGGHIGVFEGNGGDLRIGLPLQCLHDGSRWMHTPLRQSVFVEAPREAIDAIIDKHDVVRDLVTKGWVHLFQLDRETQVVSARETSGWREVAGRG